MGVLIEKMQFAGARAATRGVSLMVANRYADRRYGTETKKGTVPHALKMAYLRGYCEVFWNHPRWAKLAAI